MPDETHNNITVPPLQAPPTEAPKDQGMPDGTIVNSKGEVIGTTRALDDGKVPVEVLAEKAKYLPEWLAQPSTVVNVGGVARSIPVPPVHNPNYWKFAAARALKGWAIGAEVTAEEFDKAVDAACNGRIG